jgi:SAM-dependent methyltransferase
VATQGERRGLYRGIAADFARFRPAYPAPLFAHLRARFGLDGSGRLLDLGCGTGRLTLPLAGAFAQVVGMDPEPEMLAEAAAEASRLGVSNTTWIEGGVSDLGPHLGRFRLITLGQVLHLVDPATTLAALAPLVEPGGGIAVVDEEHPDVPSNAWRRAIHAAVAPWLDDDRRSLLQRRTEPDDVVIARSPFARVEIFALPYQRPTDVERIVGFAASTSSASRAALGTRWPRVEAEMRRALFDINPTGTFVDDVILRAVLAWKD